MSDPICNNPKTPSYKNLKIRFLYGAIVLVVASTVVWSLIENIISAKEIALAFLASLGTFLGALFAFRLNENKDYLKQQSEHRASLNRALFILARQRNAVISFKKKLIPFESEVERALNLPAHKPPQYSDLKHNFEDLEFLLEVNQVNLLMRLTIEQEGFHQTFESLRIRNEFYVDEVLPELAKHSLNGKNVTDKELYEALGERIFGTAINYANNLYYLIDESSKKITDLHSELFLVAKSLFPHDKFIKFEDQP